jgi:hypothetical protein
VNWTLFYVTFVVCFLLSSPTFALLNAYGVKTGAVPGKDRREWNGRPFVHWKEETTLFIGDTFFLTLLDAGALVACSQVSWSPMRIAWALLAVPLGAVGTNLWLKDAVAKYNAGTIKTWGWHFCGRNRFSPAGWYHTLYFGAQAMVMTLSVIFIAPQGEVNLHLKAAMVFAGLGYGATFLHHINMEKVRGNI